MYVRLGEDQQRILKAAILALERNSNNFLADGLRRTFEFDLANLKEPTDEERKRIAYASMH